MNVFEQRLTAIRRKFDDWEIDGLLITSPINRRWLSGFTGSNGQLLITKDKALLATDFRYWEQAAAESPAFELFKHRRTDEDNAAFFAAAGVTVVGIEAQHITLADQTRLDKIKDVFWDPLMETAEPLRKIKSPAEIEAIRAAATITDQAMAQVNTIARPGMSERELAWQLEKLMRESGADGMAFDVIVASGPNAALPHHHPGSRQLRAGDSLIVDMGAKLDGYHSDMTRTFYLGSEPDELFWSVYNLVQDAQTAVLDHIKPGMNGKKVDALARDVIAAAGHGDYFGHGLGHGLGLAIHEDPFLSTRTEAEIMAPGMTITIEPGIYLPGWGGVRIEDLILITEDGFEYLSHCPKEPVIRVP
ncbi:MAG: aminopeptidase P family protein [Ardenticatenaceae bacterium]|nr:aminopeptidase P family protein [Ardenticatenaceae bacterium]MCB9443306.1 aminopeptidase P family protein [Ardenticatenaceae bacterium]